MVGAGRACSRLAMRRRAEWTFDPACMHGWMNLGGFLFVCTFCQDSSNPVAAQARTPYQSDRYSMTRNQTLCLLLLLPRPRLSFSPSVQSRERERARESTWRHKSLHAEGRHVGVGPEPSRTCFWLGRRRPPGVQPSNPTPSHFICWHG